MIDYKLGLELCLDNAKSLLKVASLAAEDEKYGIAGSLNILAAEEGIKALIIFMRILDEEAEAENFNDYFKNHQVKHKTIKNFLETLTFFQFSFDKIFAPVIEKAKTITREEINLHHKKGVEEVSEWVNQVKSNKNRPILELNWWNSANTRKNEGFYVDLKGNNWYSPRKITKSTYGKEKLYTERLIAEVRKIKSLLGNEYIMEFIRKQYEQVKQNTPPNQKT